MSTSFSPVYLVSALSGEYLGRLVTGKPTKQKLVAAFQRLAGDFHLRIDMLYAEPCAPFVGAVEAALLKEVDDPAVTLGLALTLFSNMSPICVMIVFCSFEG